MYKKCLLLTPKETEDELGNVTPNGWDVKATCPARFSRGQRKKFLYTDQM